MENLSNLTDPKRDMTSDETSNIFYFIVECVVKTYGTKKISSYIERNVDSTVLDMITVSDIAYSVVVIENSGDVWEQQEYLKTCDAEELEEYKNPDKLEPEEKEMYQKKTPKYTQRKGRRAGYLSSGWNNAGRHRYREIMARWRELYADEGWYSAWTEEWTAFCEATNACAYWSRKVSSSVLESTSTEIVMQEEEVCDDDQCFRNTVSAWNG